VEEVKPKKPKKEDLSEERMKVLERRLLELESEKLIQEKKAAAKEPKFEEKEVIYQTVIFRNLEKAGVGLDFIYDLKSFRLIDGCTIEMRKQVVDHLNSLRVRAGTHLDSDKGIKEYTYRPRFICEVKSERIELQKVKVK
jgi:hypothetical protein